MRQSCLRLTSLIFLWEALISILCKDLIKNLFLNWGVAGYFWVILWRKLPSKPHKIRIYCFLLMGGFIYAIMKVVKVKKVKNWLLDFLNMACINNLQTTLALSRFS